MTLMFMKSGFIWVFGWIGGLMLIISCVASLMKLLVDISKGKYQSLNKLSPAYGLGRELTLQERKWGIKRT